MRPEDKVTDEPTSRKLMPYMGGETEKHWIRVRKLGKEWTKWEVRGYWDAKDIRKEFGGTRVETVPAFDMPDLLSVLPHRIDKAGWFMYLRIDWLKKEASYNNDNGKMKFGAQSFRMKPLLQALASLVLWCVNEGLIEKEGKSK